MKVYVVLRGEYDPSVFGIFSDYEKALACCAEGNKYGLISDHFSVETWQIDESTRSSKAIIGHTYFFARGNFCCAVPIRHKIMYKEDVKKLNLDKDQCAIFLLKEDEAKAGELARDYFDAYDAVKKEADRLVAEFVNCIIED